MAVVREEQTRHHTPLSLVMFDIDFFKKVNDTYGHLGGDAVLVHVARTVQAAVRREDLLARYGGEEFAVLARGSGTEAASLFAERLRASIEREVITFEDRAIRITISLGVASTSDAGVSAPEDLVARADQALYDAKRAGRNGGA